MATLSSLCVIDDKIAQCTTYSDLYYILYYFNSIFVLIIGKRTGKLPFPRPIVWVRIIAMLFPKRLVTHWDFCWALKLLPWQRLHFLHWGVGAQGLTAEATQNCPMKLVQYLPSLLGWMCMPGPMSLFGGGYVQGKGVCMSRKGWFVQAKG